MLWIVAAIRHGAVARGGGVFPLCPTRKHPASPLNPTPPALRAPPPPKGRGQCRWYPR